MTRRFPYASKLLSLMIGCGLAMTSLVSKAESKPHKDFKSLSDTTNTIGIQQQEIGINALSFEELCQPANTDPVAEPVAKSASHAHPSDHEAEMRIANAAHDRPVMEEEDDYPVVTKKNYAPSRSRFSMEMPFACRHSETHWNTVNGVLPVQFNENKNYGLFMNYAVMQGKKYDLTLGGGMYKNSNYGESKVAKVEYTQFLGRSNRFRIGLEAGAATYEENIVKEFQQVNGQMVIIPHGQGKDKIIPMYRAKAGFNLINNSALQLGVVGGYTYDPVQNMHLVTAGISFGIGKSHKKSSSSRPLNGGGYQQFGQNKHEVSRQSAMMQEDAAHRTARNLLHYTY